MNPCIIYIMGVSGSGKSTIGNKLSLVTGIPFFDADDYHPAANKQKMKEGLPLDDNDRKDWLEKINEMAREQSLQQGAIIACSALKEKYRAVLSTGLTNPVHWVFLQGDFGLIQERMKERKDHFMPVSLLQSQFDALEKPANAIVADARKKPDEIVAEIVRKLNPNGLLTNE